MVRSKEEFKEAGEVENEEAAEEEGKELGDKEM